MVACHGACAIGMFSLSSGRLVTQLVDDESGCAGMIEAPDGAIVIDCAGTLRMARARASGDKSAR